VIATPPEHVYAALANPEALAAWLPPAGMTGTCERFDARPGGSYRLVLTYADASASPGKATAATDIVESRFIDLVPTTDVRDGSPPASVAGGDVIALQGKAAVGDCRRAVPACIAPRRSAVRIRLAPPKKAPQNRGLSLYRRLTRARAVRAFGNGFGNTSVA
jgi:activator of Hsp90 ATPase-like protein